MGAGDQPHPHVGGVVGFEDGADQLHIGFCVVGLDEGADRINKKSF